MKTNKYLIVILIALFLITLLCFAGCGGAQGTQDSSDSINDQSSTQEQTGDQKNSDGYYMIDAARAFAFMEEESDYIILDVRTREEYESGHIPGALLLPNEQIGSEQPAELPDFDMLILVYCRSGNRSKQSSRKLARLGYTAVYEFGGIGDWPYETE